MNYKLSNIKIGDEVYFDSTTSQSNHDLYWKVIDINEKTNTLIVQLNEMGFVDLRWSISLNQVRQHLSRKN
jgi:hypothetical protein